MRRKLALKNRFYAQLVCSGKPFIKPKNSLGVGDTGIDIGPSTIALVSDTEVHLYEFASELEFEAGRIRRRQRRMDRSRRATNPDNFNANGEVKKGKKQWNNSQEFHRHQTRQL